MPMSRAHAEGRTFYSFPDAEPWEDDWMNDRMPWSWLVRPFHLPAPWDLSPRAQRARAEGEAI